MTRYDQEIVAEAEEWLKKRNGRDAEKLVVKLLTRVKRLCNERDELESRISMFVNEMIDKRMGAND